MGVEGVGARVVRKEDKRFITGKGLDEATLRQELEGNICRCTGYHNIVKAVLDAAGRMNVAQAAE